MFSWVPRKEDDEWTYDVKRREFRLKGCEKYRKIALFKLGVIIPLTLINSILLFTGYASYLLFCVVCLTSASCVVFSIGSKKRFNLTKEEDEVLQRAISEHLHASLMSKSKAAELISGKVAHEVIRIVKAFRRDAKNSEHVSPSVRFARLYNSLGEEMELLSYRVEIESKFYNKDEPF